MMRAKATLKLFRVTLPASLPLTSEREVSAKANENGTPKSHTAIMTGTATSVCVALGSSGPSQIKRMVDITTNQNSTSEPAPLVKFCFISVLSGGGGGGLTVCYELNRAEMKTTQNIACPTNVNIPNFLPCTSQQATIARMKERGIPQIQRNIITSTDAECTSLDMTGPNHTETTVTTEISNTKEKATIPTFLFP